MMMKYTYLAATILIIITLLAMMVKSDRGVVDDRAAEAANKPFTLIERMGLKLTKFVEETFPIGYLDSRTDHDDDDDDDSSSAEFFTPSNDTDDDITNCNSLFDINEYFFEIYSKKMEGENSSSELDLEDMLKFQLKRFSKNKQRNERRRKKKCPREKCILAKELLSISRVEQVNRENFGTVCPVMLYNLELENCDIREESKLLSRTTVWLVGLALTAVVTIWSFGGAVILPVIKTQFYKNALTFMISLAFGVVNSNSILKYFPLTDGFDYIDLDDHSNSYFYKHLIILVVILFFFLFERIMKIIALFKKRRQMQRKRQLKHLKINESSSRMNQSNRNSNNDTTSSIMSESAEEEAKNQPMKRVQSIDVNQIQLIGVQKINEVTNNFGYLDDDDNDEEEEEEEEEEGENNDDTDHDEQTTDHEEIEIETTTNNEKAERGGRQHQVVFTLDASRDVNINESKPAVAATTTTKGKSNRICCTSLTKGISKVRPIGWMAIFGDGLGNFIDGMSIGASMNKSLLDGITTAIATWSGNIPQELGDFALLVRAGMTPFQALIYNYFSANTAYLGFIVGATVGQSLNASKWLFSVSTATTMYISLGVLLPELKDEFESETQFNGKMMITVLQVVGIIMGYGVMISLNILENSFES